MSMRSFYFSGLLAAAFLLGISVSTAHAYSYAHNDGEYSINLPEAPTAVTIWADEKKIPYLENPPTYGAVGEIAKFKRTDPESGDLFEVTITFLRADRDSLLSLTQEKIENILKDEYKDVPMENKKISYSPGADTLKWATLTGFAVDENNNLFYNAGHFLTGQQSLYLIKIRYTAENKTFQEYYNQVTNSIRFSGK